MWINRKSKKEIGKFIQKEPTEVKLLLETIWNEGSFEARQIAGESLEKFGPKNPKPCLGFVSSVLPDLDNWAVCDNLAICGVEPIVYQNPELVLPLFKKWIKDKNKITESAIEKFAIELNYKILLQYLPGSFIMAARRKSRSDNEGLQLIIADGQHLQAL